MERLLDARENLAVAAYMGQRPAEQRKDLAAFEAEWKRMRDPLLALDNAVCTPHLGYVERDSYESYFGQAFDQVAAFAEGRPVDAVS